MNLHFESILGSLRAAVVVLDLELHVQVWSLRACELWGARSEEVQGKHFFGLDIGLAVEALSSQIRACLAAEQHYQEVLLPAVNRKGKAIQCLVKITRLTQNNAPHGIILLMEELELPPGTPSENAHGTPSGK